MTWIIVTAAACVVIGLLIFVFNSPRYYRGKPLAFLERSLNTVARTTEGSALFIEADSTDHVLKIVKNRLVDPDHLEVTFAVEWPVELDDQDSVLRNEMAEAGLYPRWERSNSGESILKMRLSGAIPEIYRQVRRIINILSDTLEISVDDTFTFSLEGEVGLDSLRMDEEGLEMVASQSKSKTFRRYAQRQLRKIRADE